MSSLSRDQIFSTREPALTRDTVDVYELGGSVLIRTLTYSEVDEFQKFQKKSGSALDLYSKLMAAGCIKEDGSPLFVGEDIPAIRGLPWPAVERIGEAIMKLSRMIKDADEESPKA